MGLGTGPWWCTTPKVPWPGVFPRAIGAVCPARDLLPLKRTSPKETLSAFEELGQGDFVALVQSTRFRLSAFRIRLELFKRGIKVVEHPHLARMVGAEARTYIESLAYDPEYYRGVGSALKDRLDRASMGLLHSGGEPLRFPVGFEPAKLNVGDYTHMKNTGGQFPIGEVFY